MQLSVEPNFDAHGNPSFSLQLERANPQPGRWRFVLLVNYYASGKEISIPFTAQIGFNTAEVTATGLPNSPSTQLSASGPPLVVPVQITNNSGLTTAYFADARLEAPTTLAFGTFPVCAVASGAVPTTLPFACFATLLPTEIHSVDFLAQATAPIDMDVLGYSGYIIGFTTAPDIGARPIAPNTVLASLTEPEVPWSEWFLFPTLLGPFGAQGAPTTPVTTTVIAQLKAFDGSVSSDYGDVWSDVTFGTSTFTTGLVLAPSASGTIHVRITPNPALAGTTVHGVLYVDTFNSTVLTGDEVYAIPYSYTVTK
jgi:hypothetical protein